MSRALSVLLAVLAGCASSGGGFPGGSTCNCVWEGPVEYQLEQAWQHEDVVYAAVHLDFVPCCSDGSSEDLVAQIDLDGSTQAGDAAGSPLSVSDDEVCVVADFADQQRRVELLCAVTASVDSDSIVIGAIYDTSDDAAAALPVVLSL